MSKRTTKPKSEPKRPDGRWAAKLKDLRKRRDLTLAVAAGMVEVPTSTWMSWEYGTRNPSKMAQRVLVSVFPELEA